VGARSSSTAPFSLASSLMSASRSVPAPSAAFSSNSTLSPKGQSLRRYRYDVGLGCPRSGTTFLMETMNALPDVECMTGTLLPVSIPQIVNADLPQSVADALAVGFERALDDYMQSGRFHSRGAALQKWVNAPTGLRGLLNAVRGHRSIDRLLYKEPFLAFAPEFVYKALPEAKIIHLYRDGRDCANSLIRTYDVLSDENLTHLMGAEMRLGRKVDHRYVPWWVAEGREQEFLAATPYGRAIWMWAYMARRCHTFFSQPEVVASGRVLQLRYEDFVQAPTEHGERILDHLDLAASRGFRRRLSEAHAGSIGKHDRRPDAEIAEAERIAGDELALLGYH
ncbi:MAG: sulfotransferase family protein, partial [Salinivenus sp.]